MAPQSNSVEVDGIDVIDVATPSQDSVLDLPKEQQQAASVPEEQERRLSAIGRVRDEADGLRQEICQLRIRLEEVEEESKFHAAKANELQELLMKSNESDGIDEAVLKQSEELAKKDCQIETLEKKITELTTEKALLEHERDNAKKEMAEMSNVVRSLQKVTTPDCSSHDGDDEDEDSDDESEDSEEIVLTPQTALDLTLGNLKDHIEMLEDGLQASSSLNSTQKKAIYSLEADIKAQQAQIGMLEELFRELNAADRVTDIKKQRAMEAAKAKMSSSESEANDDKSLNNSERSSKSSSSATQQQTLNKLGSMFRSMRMPSSNTKPKAPKKEKKPEIPEEAVAAAQAAAFLVANPNTTEETPKKTEKSPKMKKVKIRFKKAGLEGTYTGPLVDKKPHGVGTIRFTNGSTYLGEMKRGKMSGSGTLYTKNNGVLRGLFENNKFVGESTDIDLNNNEGSSHSRSHASDSESSLTKPSDATDTTAETDEQEEAKANAVAALELDAFSPSNIESDQIEDSFKMMVNLEGMERKVELDEIRKESQREENESFLKEFSGSEHSSSLRRDLFDESNSSRAEEDEEQIDPQDIF